MFETEHLLVVLPKFPLYFHKPIGAIFVVVLKMWYLLFSSVREYIWNAFGTLNAMCNSMFSLTIVYIVRLPMSYNMFSGVRCMKPIGNRTRLDKPKLNLRRKPI